MLLALDPGLRSPGIALFDSGALQFADRIRVPDFSVSPTGARWLLVATQILDALIRRGEDDLIDTIIFECPQVYTREKSKGDPNHLVSIAGVAACLVGMLACNNPQILSPHPGEWIGQLAKTCHVCKKNLKKCPECKGSAWSTPRGRRIRSRLSDAELALVPDQNDAIDAVGLGLWSLGRLQPRCVYSNGKDRESSQMVRKGSIFSNGRDGR